MMRQGCDLTLNSSGAGWPCDDENHAKHSTMVVPFQLRLYDLYINVNSVCLKASSPLCGIHIRGFLAPKTKPLQCPTLDVKNTLYPCSWIPTVPLDEVPALGGSGGLSKYKHILYRPSSYPSGTPVIPTISLLTKSP